MTTKPKKTREQTLFYAADVQLTIKADFQALCPRQTEEERALLKADIEANGCRDAIKVYGNIPVDGHTRLEFCEELGIEFPIERLDFPDDDAAKKWIILSQLGRRNLSPGQYSELRAQLYEAEKNDRGGDRKSEEKSKPQNEVLISTAENVAKKTGVSKATIERDVAYAKALDSLVPSLRDDIKSRAIKCSKADVIKLAAMSKDDQVAAAVNAKLHSERKIVIPDAAPKGDATNGKPKSELLDGLKKPVPEKLIEVFEAGEKFKDIRSHFKAITDALEELAKLLGGTYLAPQLQDLTAKVKSAKGDIDQYKPYCVCPYCKGKKKRQGPKCNACKDRGWVHKPLFSAAPSDAKEAAK